MGLIETQTLTGAEIIANYARIRKAFYPVQRKPIVVTPKPPVVLSAKELAKRPLWSIIDTRFDAHVERYHAYLLKHGIKVKPAKSAVESNAPLWKQGATVFNRHVVDFLHYKINCESEGQGPASLKKPTTMIFAEVLRFFPTIDIDHIRGHRRTRAVVLPRQLCAWEAKTQRPDLSFPEIGRRLGGKDHTTILHAVRKIQELKDSGQLDWYFNARDIE